LESRVDCFERTAVSMTILGKFVLLKVLTQGPSYRCRWILFVGSKSALLETFENGCSGKDRFLLVET
jgi:hypothetical protein